MNIYVITFESTHAAMAASKALSKASYDYANIPVPTAISAGCGMAVRIESDDPKPIVETICAALHKNGNPEQDKADVSIYIKEGISDYSPVSI